MKPIRSKHNSTSGSALMVVVVIMPILIGLVIAALVSANQANQESMRAQAWNTVMPVAEAGIEDALTHLNVHGATNLTCDGWQSVNAGKIYRLQRTIGDHTYLAVISNYVAGSPANKPLIECRGYARLSGPQATYLTRGIRVITEQRIPMRGVIARGQIELQDVIVDSYDSLGRAFSVL